MSAGSSFGGMCAAPEISAIVIDLSGEPRTWYLPSDQLDVLGRGLEQRRADRFALSCTLLRRAHDRLAADRQRARAVGVPAPRALVGVAVDARPRSAGRSRGCRRRSGRSSCRAPGRAATCPCRRSPSPVGVTRTFADSQKAAWRPTPCGPTARDGRQAAHLDVGREADAAVDALAAQLAPARARNSSRSKCSSSLSSAPCVVAGVVEDAERRLERELVARDEVLAPQLEPVHAELVGEPVHHQLDPVGGLRPAGAADRVGGHLVGEHAREVQVDVRDPVAAAHHREAQLRDERA